MLKRKRLFVLENDDDDVDDYSFIRFRATMREALKVESKNAKNKKSTHRDSNRYWIHPAGISLTSDSAMFPRPQLAFFRLVPLSADRSVKQHLI